MATTPPGSPPDDPPDDPAGTERRITYPPTAWDREDIVSSAPFARGPARVSAAFGEVTGGRLRELEARALLGARFAQAGFAMIPEAPFLHADLLVTLDGWDPDRRVGYLYASHADADVVSDLDAASELALRELAAEGVADIFIVQDSQIADAASLTAAVDDIHPSLAR